MIDEILKYNKEFVEEKKYEQYKTSKYPDKKIAIITCMDTRLTAPYFLVISKVKVVAGNLSNRSSFTVTSVA